MLNEGKMPMMHPMMKETRCTIVMRIRYHVLLTLKINLDHQVNENK